MGVKSKENLCMAISGLRYELVRRFASGIPTLRSCNTDMVSKHRIERERERERERDSQAKRVSFHELSCLAEKVACACTHLHSMLLDYSEKPGLEVSGTFDKH
jgi:uncharacterized membrane protein YgaE (UPF0421/DUF939 family)